MLQAQALCSGRAAWSLPILGEGGEAPLRVLGLFLANAYYRPLESPTIPQGQQPVPAV